ncbi:MAG TPA: cation-transporting P-type ATPase [Thermoanaerobaculia bacterium]|nr:cation-transporting P-type ATPase [Thermoanaerobaculia bacterium]
MSDLPLPPNPWALPSAEVADALGVRPGEGLSEAEAARRLEIAGPNRLREARPVSAWTILLRQVQSLVTLLLVAATAASFIFREWAEGIAIAAVILLNTGIGFFTELKAVRSMEALRRLGISVTRVRREGKVRAVPAEELAPGDVAILEAGDLVTADLRLLAASRLQVDESQLTGESLPVDKGPDPVPAETPLAERTGMLFRGTPVVRGSGEGVVVATGMATELGRIAALAEASGGERTPLEDRLERLGRTLGLVTLGIAALTTIMGVLAGRGLFLMIETGIALAVAAVPEGLPIVATLALARGVWRMARRNALVNRLSSVETLGSVTLVATDKTGTLTENRMTLTRLAVEGDDLPPEAEAPEARRALEIAVLCNNADSAAGDPLELALLAAGERAGLDRAELLRRFPREREEAFDPATQMMATFHRASDGGFRVAVKGAPEAVLAACGLADAEHRRWLGRNHELGAQGFRILGLAERTSASADESPYSGLSWRGLAVLEDPPRADARPALDACRKAGIRVVMVTGDQAPTAAAVARSVGLGGDDPKVVTGRELRRAAEASPEEHRRLLEADVFARVDPEQKLDLVSLFQHAGGVVAMTGDGVNDAPALRKADIGIAMGRHGSQVAREAADVVLKDDSLATLAAAVRQGRVIFGNIRRFVFFLLSCNTSEVLVVASAPLTSLPLPVLPLQLLFLNLVTDVLPALALGMGEGGPHVMERPPRDPKEPLLGRRQWLGIAGYAAVMTAAVFGALEASFRGLHLGEPRSATVAFLTLAFAQLWHGFNMGRSEVVRNPWLWGAVAVCSGLLLLAVYLPPLAAVLRLSSPGAAGWGLVAAASLVPWGVGMGWAWIRRVL